MSGEAPTQGPIAPEAPKPQLPPEVDLKDLKKVGSAFNMESTVKKWFVRPEDKLRSLAQFARAHSEARLTAKSGDEEDQLTPEQKAAGETLMNRYSTVRYAEGQGEQQGSLEAGLSDQQRYLIDNIRAQVLENHAIDTQPENGQYSEGQHTDIVVRKGENGHLVVSVVTGNRGEFDISEDGTEVAPKDATKPLTVEVIQYDHDPVKGILDVASPNDDLKDQHLVPAPPRQFRGEPNAVFEARKARELAQAEDDAPGMIDAIINEAAQNAYMMTLTPRELAGYSVKVLDIQAKDPPITPEEKTKQDGKALREVGRLIADDKYNPDNPPTVYAGNDAYREMADRVRFKDGRPAAEVVEDSEATTGEKTVVKVETGVEGLTAARKLELAGEVGKGKRVDQLDFQIANPGDNGVVAETAINRVSRRQDRQEEDILDGDLTYDELVVNESADSAALLLAMAPDQAQTLMNADAALTRVQQRISEMAVQNNRSAREVAQDNFALFLAEELQLGQTSLEPIPETEVQPAWPDISTEVTTPAQTETIRQIPDTLQQRLDALRDRVYPQAPEDAARAVTFGGEIDDLTKYTEAVQAQLRRGDLSGDALQARTRDIINDTVNAQVNEILAMTNETDRQAAAERLQKEFGASGDALIKFRLDALAAIYPVSTEVAIGRMDFTTNRATTAGELRSIMEDRARGDNGEITEEDRGRIDARMAQIFINEITSLRGLEGDAAREAVARLRERFRGYEDPSGLVETTLLGLEQSYPEPLNEERFMAIMDGTDRAAMEALNPDNLTPTQRALREARLNSTQPTPEQANIRANEALATFGTTVYGTAAEMRTAFNDMIGSGVRLDESQRAKVETQIRAREEQERQAADAALQLKIAQAQFGVLATLSPEMAQRVKDAVAE